MSELKDTELGKGILFLVLGFIALSIILFILMIVFAILPDRLLHSENLDPMQLSKDSALTTQSFEIPKDVSICRLDIIADLKKDGIHWITVDAEIFNQEDEPVNAFGGELYYEFGYDDGNWEEAEENIKHHFKIDSVQGQKFYAEIYAEKGLDLRSANQAKIEFRVKDGKYSLYRKVTGYASLISFILSMVILFKTAGLAGTFD